METMAKRVFPWNLQTNLNGFENWKKENKLLKEIVIQKEGKLKDELLKRN
jgi:hypothetical protein